MSRRRSPRFAERAAEDLRLVLLSLLAASRGWRANESLLKMACADRGHTISRDRLRTELAWLAEQGLAETDEIGGVMIAGLTERGADAASGAALIPGVRRPPAAGLEPA